MISLYLVGDTDELSRAIALNEWSKVFKMAIFISVYDPERVKHD